MSTTANHNIPLPTATANVSDDVDVLIAAFEAIDTVLASLSSAVSGKAASAHAHAISEITGLSDAIAGLAALSHSHTLGSLSDVDVSSIAVGYILKWSGTGFVPTSAAAALGTHGHTISQITDLVTALAAKLAKESNLSDLDDVPTARTNLGLGSIAQLNIVTVTVAPDPATLAEGTIVLVVDA